MMRVLYCESLAGFVNFGRASVLSEQMHVRPSGRRLRSLAFAGLAIYALFLVVSPFEHHDLSCELKTPQHCTACTSSLVGADPNALAVPDAWHFTDAGSAVSTPILAIDTLLTVRSAGRSPPARA
jgi:hypothetical protein